MSVPKKIRMSRFLYPDARMGLIVPIDHGLTMGPISGIESTAHIAKWIRHPAICGTIAHKGMIERLGDQGLLASKGVMMHLNGMSTLASDSNKKERLTSVETAIRMGADAVSIQINFDGTNDTHNLQLLGQLVDEAHEFGLPVLTMLYDFANTSTSNDRIQRLRHLMRIAIELGTDALKIGPPETSEEFSKILNDLAADVHIFVAGGSLSDESKLIELVQRTKDYGGSGVCLGRNIFQRDSTKLLERIRDIMIHG